MEKFPDLQQNEGSENRKTPSKPETQGPFKEPLVGSGFKRAYGVKSLESNPEVIVRAGLRFPVRAEQEAANVNEGRSVEETVDRFNTGKKLFEELKHYGVEVPKMDMVIGPYKEINAVGQEVNVANVPYIVTERIHGSDLSRTNFSPEEIAQAHSKMDEFYAGRVAYLLDKYKSGGNYLSDLRNSQFIYGNRKSEPDKKVFVVDLDPYYENYNAQNRTQVENVKFFDSVVQLTADLRAMENKLNDQVEDGQEKTSLNKARALFTYFLDSIPQDDLGYQQAQEAKRFLEK